MIRAESNPRKTRLEFWVDEGSIVNVGEPSEFVYTGGQWDRYELSAVGKRLKVTLNGRDLVNVEDSPLSAGPIALQHGSGTFRLRNMPDARLGVSDR